MALTIHDTKAVEDPAAFGGVDALGAVSEVGSGDDAEIGCAVGGGMGLGSFTGTGGDFGVMVGGGRDTDFYLAFFLPPMEGDLRGRGEGW